MKIVHISTYDIVGGAALAAYQLSKALEREQVHSTMVVKYKYSNDPMVHVAEPGTCEGDIGPEILAGPCFQHYLNWKKKDANAPLFSFPYPGYDLSNAKEIKKADILHIHWITDFLSPYTLGKLFGLGKKIVITCHDQRIFTGGCHCVGECSRYINDCRSCPQIWDDPLNLPSMMLAESNFFLKGKPIHFVTPSRWLKEKVCQSRLFKTCPVNHIPNSVDTEIFKPDNKLKARKELEIEPDAVILLFGASSIDQKIKGLDHLIHAIKTGMARFRTVKRKTAWQNTILLTFGNDAQKIIPSDIRHISLGYVTSRSKLRLAYCAADYLCLPSLEDNFPNTMVESMACGTPVIAYETGGIPEMVIHGQTGFLAPAGDKKKLADCLCQAVLASESAEKMSRRCRSRALSLCSPVILVKRYLELYSDLLRNVAPHLPSERWHPRPNIRVPVLFKFSPELHCLIKKMASHEPAINRSKEVEFIHAVLNMDILSGVRYLPKDAFPHLFCALVDVIMHLKGELTKEKKYIYGHAVWLFSRIQPQAIDIGYIINFVGICRDFNDSPMELEVCEAALAFDPRNSQFLLLKGIVLRETGRLEDALAIFCKAAENKDEFFMHVKTLEGAILRDLGKLEKSLLAFNVALSCDPGNMEIRQKSLDVLIRLKRYDEAIDCADNGLKLVPDQYDLLLAKGKLLEFAGHHEAASNHREKIRQLFPDI